MYSLYYQPFSCSFAVHCALEKIGKPFELHKVNLNKGEHKQPEFLKINPLAQVPVLIQNDQTIKQAAAILLYLSEQHPEAELMPLAGSENPDRPAALQSLFYLSNTVHPTFARLFYPERVSESAKEEVKAKAVEKIMGILVELDELFATQDYCAGNTLYAPDYYLMAMLNWLRLFSISISEFPNLKGYLGRLKSHTEISTITQKEMMSFAA